MKGHSQWAQFELAMLEPEVKAETAIQAHDHGEVPTAAIRRRM